MNPVWKADILLKDDQIRELLTNQCHEICPIEITKIAEGWDNYIYEVNRHYIFRFPKRQIAVPLMEMEIKLLPFLSRHLSKKIPLLTHIGKPSNEYPYPFMGYEKISGSTLYLSQNMDMNLISLAHDLGTFLRQLHSIPLHQLEHLKLPLDEINRMNPENRREKWIHISMDLKAAATALDVDTLTKFFNKSIEIGFQEDVPLSIVHGDLYPLQILVNEHYQLSGVIDWGDCHLGDSAVDLSVLLSSLPYSAHESFFSAYGTISKAAWHRARFRAIYHCAIIVLYGLSIQNQQITDTGLFGLQNIMQS